jgi:hypothetical protein
VLAMHDIVQRPLLHLAFLRAPMKPHTYAAPGLPPKMQSTIAKILCRWEKEYGNKRPETRTVTTQARPR